MASTLALLKRLILLAIFIQAAYNITFLASHSATLIQGTPNNNYNNQQPSQYQNRRSSINDFLPKVLVIYFPQFHPDPLNDRLWGANFSDWNNLIAAPAKNKEGFSIPRPLPFDPATPVNLLGGEDTHSGLGYYDLRDVDIRRRQSELARLYEIDGFIYHHYWFYDPSYNGPTLHAPLIHMLKDGYPDLPFFLNWCAVSWINVWMGRAQWQDKSEKINMNKAQTLQQQYFNATDAMIREHYDWLRQFFRHKNYIKIDGQPVFFTYQWRKEMEPILIRLREFAIEDGWANLYLVVGRGAAPSYIHDASDLTKSMRIQMSRKTQPIEMFPMETINQTMVYPYPAEYIHKPLRLPNWCKTEELPLDYANATTTNPEINGIPISFDNTPRRDFNNANLWNVGPNVSSVVQRFHTSLKSALAFDTCCYHPSHRLLHKQERFVVINAWNEWGEGMALEPSDVYGNKFLQTVKLVKNEVRSLFNELDADGRCVFSDGLGWNFVNETNETVVVN